MKYTQKQKEIVIDKGLAISFKTARLRNSLKQIFPIAVEIEGCFYIIESKMNNL